VIFMSGYTAEILGRQGAMDEETHFLSKPFTLESLAQKVREALELGADG